MKRSITKRTLSGFKWTAMSNIATTLLRLVFMSVLAHLLTPHDFGLVAIAQIFIEFSNRFGVIGFGAGLVQRKELNDKHISSNITLTLIIGLIFCGILFAMSPLLADFFHEPLLAEILCVMSLIFVANSIGLTSKSMLRREFNFRELTRIEIFAFTFSSAAISVPMAFWGYGAWSLVFGALGQSIIISMLALIAYPIKQGAGLHLKESKELVSAGMGFSLSAIMEFLATTGDNFIIGRWLGAPALGLYGRAYKLMTLPSNALHQIFNRVMFSAFSEIQSQREKSATIFIYSMEVVTLAAMPISALLFFASPELVSVVLGNKWLEVIPVLQVLSLGVFLRAAYRNTYILARSFGAVYRLSWRQGAFAFFVLGGAFYGSNWGIVGASYGVIAALGINYALSISFTSQLLQVKATRILRSHLPGLWTTAWLSLTLHYALNFCRAYNFADAITLIFTLPISALVTIMAVKLAPNSVKISFTRTIAENNEITMLGKENSFARNLLLAISK